tara:strand:- start:880 stop:1116 length:237 start_codon:yes stop_codon:yes gene_type:complete
MIDDDDSKRMVDEVSDIVIENISELITHYNGTLVAGVLMCNTIRLYKVILSDDDFKSTMKMILESVDDIEGFKKPTIQ